MHVGFARATVASSLAITFVWACGARTQLDTPYGPNAGAGVNEPEKPARCNLTKVTQLASREQTDAPTDDFWDQIVLDDADVYFHSLAAIRRVPKNGGTVEIVAANIGRVWPSKAEFVLDSRGLAYLTGTIDGFHFARANANGGAPVIVGPKLPLFGPVVHLTASHDGYFVWGQTDFSEGLLTVDDDGAPTSPVVSTPTVVGGVIDESPQPAYVATGATLSRYDPTQGVLTTLLPLTLYELVDGGDALFGVGAKPGSPLDYEIFRIDKATETSSVLLAYGKPILGIAVDSTDVYFCDRFAATVVKVPRLGGATTIVGPAPSPQGQSIDVAVDQDCIYWTVLDGPDDGVARLFAAPKHL